MNPFQPLLIGFLLALVINLTVNTSYWLSRAAAIDRQPILLHQAITDEAKFFLLERLIAKGWQPIVFVGSSHVALGVNPGRFSRLPNALNLGFKGAFMSTSDVVLQVILNQRRKPALMVIELSPLTSNRNDANHAIEKAFFPYLLSRDPHMLVRILSEQPMSLLTVFLNYQGLQLLPLLAGQKKEAVRIYPEPLYGQQPRPFSPHYRKMQVEHLAHFDRNFQTHFDRYQFDSQKTERLMTLLKQAGVPAVFVRYPLVQSLRQAIAERGYERAFYQGLNPLLRQHRFSYLDFSRVAYPNYYFNDLHHMNQYGAEHFSLDLERALLPVLQRFTIDSSVQSRHLHAI